jgi:prevent-host-death family protein
MASEPHYIAVSDFKARCLGLLDDVAETHRMLIITKFGKPIARVMPMENTKPPLLGSWKGAVEISGDIVHFDTSLEWEAANEG